MCRDILMRLGTAGSCEEGGDYCGSGSEPAPSAPFWELGRGWLGCGGCVPRWDRGPGTVQAQSRASIGAWGLLDNAITMLSQSCETPPSIVQHQVTVWRRDVLSLSPLSLAGWLAHRFCHNHRVILALTLGTRFGKHNLEEALGIQSHKCSTCLGLASLVLGHWFTDCLWIGDNA